MAASDHIWLNPIGLTMGGELLKFHTLKDFYLKVLELLLQNFPRGYIDYMLFLHDYTSLRGTPLGECCKRIENSWNESDHYCISVHWTYEIQSRDTLTDLVRKMSRQAAGSDFDIYEFDAAWRKFWNDRLSMLM